MWVCGVWFTLVGTHIGNVILMDIGHGILVHWWIALSNMSGAFGMLYLMILTVTLTLKICNLVNNVLLAADVVDEEVHAMLAVIAR